jgi:two-component system NtrC family sensor kinase
LHRRCRASTPRSTTSQQLDFELVSAFQGKDGYDMVVEARAAGRPFAMAFVDMRMPPGWDGLETLENIWRVDPDIQIVICSAYSDHSWSDLRARLGDRDALLILKKPFDTIEVIQCAHALTSKWNLARDARAHLATLESAVANRTKELEGVNRALADQIVLRDRMEAELRLAQKLEAIGQLASGIAHEINTPIQFVADNLEFIRETTADVMKMAVEIAQVVEPYRESAPGLVALVEQLTAAADLGYLSERIPSAVESMQQGVTRIATIVRAMKEFAHPGTGDAAPCDLNHALDVALQVTRNAYRYIADVETRFETIPAVVCNLGALNQVFLNLIVNAAHAMEDREGQPRGVLGIATRVDGDSVVISISDTGCGIPPAVRDRIFDAFFTTKAVGRGTGQGLAIARSIVVERHRGSIGLDSVVGQGTTFHIRLPVAGVPASASDSVSVVERAA